jgi:phytoene dehydrogenase-like protein
VVTDYDAVVVGSGPNGLAAAVTLTAAGQRVLVVERAAAIGGGCRTSQLTLPGFRHDDCSAVHALALASPFFRAFDLVGRGIRFAFGGAEYAHPLDGARAAVVRRDVTQTAAGLGADGDAYRRLFGPLTRHADAITATVLSDLRHPPRQPVAVARYGLAALRSAQRAATRFRTAEARALFAGLAAHGMMPLSQPPTAGLALFLGLMAHSAGWPVVVGGSGQITRAMAQYVRDGGGTVETGRQVRSLRELPSARAVLLDVTPRALIAIAGAELPPGYRRALDRFRYGAGICKADYALSGPVPWANPGCKEATTLHLGGSFSEISRAEADVAAGRHPEAPYVLAVQPGVADPGRAPAGQHVFWTYCHVPARSPRDMSAAIEAQIERFAPGFGDLIRARSVRTAAQEEDLNPNYVGGDISAGLMTVRQTFARPVRRWNSYRTPLPGVYLCSSSTPPGPGVHGRCGELAARTALRDVFGIRKLPDLSAIAPPGVARRLHRHLDARSSSPGCRTHALPRSETEKQAVGGNCRRARQEDDHAVRGGEDLLQHGAAVECAHGADDLALGDLVPRTGGRLPPAGLAAVYPEETAELRLRQRAGCAGPGVSHAEVLEHGMQSSDMLGDRSLPDQAALTGFGGDRRDPGSRRRASAGSGDRPAGAGFLPDHVGQAVRYGEVVRAILRRAGLVQRERLQRLYEVAAVGVDVGVGVQDEPGERIVGESLGERAARVTGKTPVEVLAVFGYDERHAACKGGHIQHGHGADAAADLPCLQVCQPAAHAAHRCVLAAMHAGNHGEQRPVR